MEFCHPMPDATQLDSFYRNYSDVRAAEEVLLKNGQRHIKRLKKYGINKASCLLDFGCGQGTFARLGGKDWKNFDQYTYFEPKMLQTGKFDCVTLWGVLEHVIDPVRTMKEINRYLRSNGYMFLTTVSVETNIPYQHKPPEHLTYWTKQAMGVGFKKSGFEMILYEPYKMVQKRDVYMNAVLRTVPMNLKRYINYIAIPEMVEVPTNEVFVVGKKCSKS